MGIQATIHEYAYTAVSMSELYDIYEVPEGNFLYIFRSIILLSTRMLEWVSCDWTLSIDQIYSNRKSNRKYIRKSILAKNRLYPVYGTETTGNYGKVRLIASTDHFFRIFQLKQLKRNLVASDMYLDKII